MLAKCKPTLCFCDQSWRFKMAEEEDLEDVTEGEQPAKKKKPLLLIIAAAVVVVAGAGTGAYFMLGQGSVEAAVDEKATVAKSEKSDKGGETPATVGEAYYFSLDPPFIVNFAGTRRARFLQVSIEGLTRDSRVKEDITKHLPQVRNSLVLLLSSKTYEELNTMEGKASLRKQVLREIQKILEAETGHEGVEDVFFTSFVMQ